MLDKLLLLIFILGSQVGDFRVSPDGMTKVYYLSDEVALFREMHPDFNGERFWYTLDKSSYQGPHELAVFTGDRSKGIIVNQLEYIQNIPKRQVILGYGLIEKHREKYKWHGDQPTEFFIYSTADNSIQSFATALEFDDAAKKQGLHANMESPELLLEKIERGPSPLKGIELVQFQAEISLSAESKLLEFAEESNGGRAWIAKIQLPPGGEIATTVKTMLAKKEARTNRPQPISKEHFAWPAWWNPKSPIAAHSFDTEALNSVRAFLCSEKDGNVLYLEWVSP